MRPTTRWRTTRAAFRSTAHGISLALTGSLLAAPPSVPGPIPAEGAVPTMVGADTAPGEGLREGWTIDAPEDRADPDRPDARDPAVELRRLRREHFGSIRVPEIRRRGLERLASFGDADAIELLYRSLRREAADVRAAMLDRIRSFGAKGQAALAWIAIEDPDPALRSLAAGRLDRPATPATLGVLDLALRQTTHATVNRAGALAGSLNALPAIPHLIFAQVASDEITDRGDLAWIAIGTQKSYVSNVVPVLGNGSGAFTPVVNTILEGVVLRITDAVAVTYRADAHQALVSMTSADWGRSTAHLGYDPKVWWAWYHEEYLPFKRAQAEESAARAKAEEAARRAESDPLE